MIRTAEREDVKLVDENVKIEFDIDSRFENKLIGHSLGEGNFELKNGEWQGPDLYRYFHIDDEQIVSLSFPNPKEIDYSWDDFNSIEIGQIKKCDLYKAINKYIENDKSIYLIDTSNETIQVDDFLLESVTPYMEDFKVIQFKDYILEKDYNLNNVKEIVKEHTDVDINFTGIEDYKFGGRNIDFSIFGKTQNDLSDQLHKLMMGEKSGIIKGLIKEGKPFDAKLKLVPGKNDGEINIEVYLDKKQKQEKNKGVKL